MNGLQFPSILLSAIVFAPFLAFLLVPFFPERTADDRSRVRLVALAGAGASFLLTAFFAMLGQIGLAEAGGQSSANEENVHWLPFSFTANYHLTADGVTLPLLLITTLLFTCLVFHSWKVHERVRLYVALLLLLETAVNGVLCSADYVLFLLFWGMQILPMYLMIRLWGTGERARAANRFLAMAVLSFVLLTVAVVLIVGKSGLATSDIFTNYATLPHAVEPAVFGLTLAAFAIAMGIVPVHRWGIHATTHAAPGVSAALSGTVMTLGAYGLIRVTLPTVPFLSTKFSLLVMLLGLVSAGWGTACALAQDDLRRFIAYTNLARLGIVLMAIGAHTSLALEGAILLLVAHGLASAMLLLLAGSLEERTRTRSIRALGGLVAQVPRLTGLWMFAVFTAVGVPLLAGFVAEFMLFSGSFPTHRIVTVIAMATLVVSSGALVWAAHRIFFGAAQETFARARDATALELMYLLPIAVMVLLFGIRPGAVTPIITNGLLPMATRLTGG